MPKKLSFLLWGVLCICLLNCYNHKTTTIQGVTYTMEEEEGVEKYANHRYYPLLEIVQRWEDFHDEKYSAWINHCNKQGFSPDTIQYFEQTFKKAANSWHKLKKPILQLLSGEETINDYLYHMADHHLADLCYRSFSVAEFLLEKGKMGIYPSTRKLFDFLRKDIDFITAVNEKIVNFVNPIELAKHSARLYRRPTTNFYLINELIQKAVDLTLTEEITQQLKDLLASLLVEEKDTHPDAIGGIYALLGDILFGENLDAAQRKHVKELKHLLKFDEIRRQEKANFAFVKKLFEGIYYHTDPAISHCILQLLRNKAYKIAWNNQTLLKDLTYKGKKFGVIITSPIAPCTDPRCDTQATWTTTDWMAYIEEDTASNKKLKGRHAKQPHQHAQSYQPGGKNRTKPIIKKINPAVDKKEDPVAIASPIIQAAKSTKDKIKPSIISPTPLADTFPPQLKPTGEKSHLNGKDSNDPISPVANTPYPVWDDKAFASPPTSIREEKKDRKEAFAIPGPYTSSSLAAPPSTLKKRASLPNLTPAVHSLSNEVPQPSLKKVPLESKPIRLNPIDRLDKPTTRKEKTLYSKRNEHDPSPMKEIPSLTKEVARNSAIELTPACNFLINFNMPRGLRTFHAQMLSNAYSVILSPKNQDKVDLLFDSKRQCNTTYKDFKTLWEGNGGFILANSGGSHRTLQYPKHVNLFGIYQPHGANTGYGKKAIDYLQAAVLYIGLRPTNIDA